MNIFTRISPLRANVPIVDKAGRPLPAFVHLINKLFPNDKATSTAASSAQSTADDALSGLDAKADKTTQIISGGGLTGGGDLSANRTLAVGAGTGITVNADDVAIDTTAEAERIRDVIGAALVAGANVTITANDAGDTITIASSGGGGGGGGSWALAGSGQTATGIWDQAVDGTKANVDFTGLSGYSEILIVVRNATQSVSGVIALRCSVNNGSSFYSASGDYVAINETGVEGNTTGVAIAWTGNATAARSGAMRLSPTNINGVIKVGDSLGIESAASAQKIRYFVASTSPVDAVRVYPSGGGNITGGKIYCFAR